MAEIMTKQKYVNYVVDKFCANMGIDRSTMTAEKWIPYIKPTTNSTLAICLEYLNMLDDKGLSYISNKKGVHNIIDPLTFEVISVRDYIASLPDDGEACEQKSLRLNVNNITLDELINIFKQNGFTNYTFNINCRFDVDYIGKTITASDRK